MTGVAITKPRRACWLAASSVWAPPATGWRTATIDAWLSFCTRGDPGTVALDDGHRRVMRGELAGLIHAERAWLSDSGGRRFGLLADNGCAWALTDLTLTGAGLLHVPLPRWFTPAQCRHVLVDAGIDRLVTDEPERVLAIAPECRIVGRSPVTGLTLLARVPESAAALPGDTVKVTYTSGSTGSPRGVCLSRDLQQRVAGAVAEATADLGIRRHLCLLPLPLLLENLAGLLAPLAQGATCLLPGSARTGVDAAAVDRPRLLRVLHVLAPHSVILVPELLRALVDAAEGGWSPPASLRFAAVGGASVAPALLHRAAQAGLPVFEGYGLSECGSVVSLNTPGANRPGSVGRPLPHVRVRVDRQGEIHVAGGAMAGYLGAPPGTSTGQEIATGDLGRIDADGYLYVHGRRRNLLITSYGRNLSPEWVEGELLLEPEIAQAVVVGDGRPFAVALLSPARPDHGQREIQAAVERANARLPRYARVPRWTLVPEPFSSADGTLTANARPRRDAIRARYAVLIDRLYDDAIAS